MNEMSKGMQMNDMGHPSTSVVSGRSNIIAGSGQMADLVRNHPWSSTALGPIEGWSPALTFTVNLVLNCPSAAAVYWGPEMIFIGNDETVRLIGSRTVEFLGHPAPLLWGPHWHEVEGQIHAVLSSGESFRGKSVPMSFSRMERPTELFVNYTLSPIYEDCKIVGIFRTLEEITETVLSMRALAESNERLSMALSAGNCAGVWDWHIQSGLVYADENMAKMYGIDPKQAAAGTSNLLYERMLHPEDIPVLTDAIMACITTGDPYSVEYRVRRADDSYRWVQSTGRCVFDEKGHASRVMGIKFDITERKNAEAMAQSTEPRPDLLPREEWQKLPATIRTFLEGTVCAMADKPGDVRLRVVDGINGTQLIFQVESADLGKVIGKQGRTIRSIRTLLLAVTGGGPRYSIDIEPNSPTSE